MEFTHEWRGIPVSRYIYLTMANIVCADFADTIDGKDTKKLVITLYAVRHLAKKVIAKEVDIFEHIVGDYIKEYRKMQKQI